MEMRKLNLILIGLLTVYPLNVQAAAPNRTYNYVSHTTIDPTQNNTNENSLYSYLQAGVDTYASGSITNDAISSSAAIGYSKLNLLGSITNADVSASAGIVGSKLDLSSPGVIGSGTPAAGTFTALTGSTLNISGSVNLGSTHQGDILYDNGTSIVRLTPGISGQFLKTQGNSANPLWDSVPSDNNTSNVLFQYSAVVDQTGSGLGEIVGTTLVPTTATGNYRFLSNRNAGGGSYRTVWSTKWKKFSGVSTITVYAQVWSDSSGGSVTVTSKVNVGSAFGTGSGTVNTHTPEWINFTIDVSGLSNGTTYDVTVQLSHAESATNNDFLGNLIAFGS